jgi:malate synthase
LVRPRGWHLEEKHVLVDGEPMSGSLFDFGVYFFHNYQLRREKGLGGCFFYLPKIEAYQEARLWNEVFLTTQNYFKVPVGTIRCTVLIETIGGSLAMDEILFELKEHIVALNAGRWDYIFSIIKKLKARKDAIVPDRGQVTMTVPFMKAYTERLIHICHKRGAHAIGGMSAFIPSKTDKKFNENVFKKIIADKELEAQSGCDGSWVAHPGLVKIARAVFEKRLGNKEHQKDVLRPEVNVRDFELTDLRIPGATITENGVRNNINVCIQYIYHWLNGSAAVGIHNLMEDAATAEISRSQLWQWVRYQCKTENGKVIDQRYYQLIRDEEVKSLRSSFEKQDLFEKACNLTDELVLSDTFAEFLTLPAYDWLVTRETKPRL